MRTGGLIIICFLLLAACSDKKEIPSGILPKKKMRELVWDLMRADQFLGNYVFTRDTTYQFNRDSMNNRTTESLKYYQRIFKLHNTTKEEFEKSFTWYRTHPVLFKEIMDSISTPELAPTGGVEPAPTAPLPGTIIAPETDTPSRKKINTPPVIPLDL